ncbi:MAG: YecA family protein, partial [Longimicrobiales bacterium]
PDLFDLLDEIDVQIDELEQAGEPTRSSAREKWKDQRAGLSLQHGAARWAIERGARDVGQARAMLLGEAMHLARRYGDPQGYFTTTPAERAEPKTGRNDPCPCGSGRKFKKCCGRNESAVSTVSKRPELVTSDHEVLTFSQAIYSVSNRAAVMAALESCPLLDYDRANDSFVWFEAIDELAKRVLGVIRMGDDWLILESMSEARLGRLTTLVQTIAGDWITLRGDRHDHPMPF